MSEECDIYHYWYFLDQFGFKFQANFYSGCHEVLMMSMNSDTTILNINGSDYRCIITGISKSGAIRYNAKYRFE